MVDDETPRNDADEANTSPEAEQPLTTASTEAPTPTAEPTPSEVPTDAEMSAASAPLDARAVTVISLRVVRGLAGLAAAIAVIGAVGLLPLPTFEVDPVGTTVEPQPAELLAVCPGAGLRLGDETGSRAGESFPVGEPVQTVAADGSPDSRPLSSSAGAAEAAPTLWSLDPQPGAVLTAAQAQQFTGDGNLEGLAVASCTEPGSSAWFVGGSTEVGRTTLLVLTNPSGMQAEVDLEIWAEDGPVSAPGMRGISVPAGGQRVLSLAGFVPEAQSPMVHVEARGGQIVASMQLSVMRVLDPGGIDVIAAGAPPAKEVTIPAVRIADALGVASALGREGYNDLEPMVRIGNPGDETATVLVSVLPTDAEGTATAFSVEVPPGQVLDTELSIAFELGASPFADGSYAVQLRSDVPVVGAVRTSTVPAVESESTDDSGSGEDAADDSDGEADSADEAPASGVDATVGPVDVGWFSSASVLTGDVALAVADASAPLLVAVAGDETAHVVELVSLDGGPSLQLAVPTDGAASVALEPGSGYRVVGAKGVVLGVSFAGAGQLGAYPLSSPRAADSPLVIRP